MKHYQKPLLSTSLNRPFYERNKRNMEIRKEMAHSAKRYFLGGTYHNAITVVDPHFAICSQNGNPVSCSTLGMA